MAKRAHIVTSKIPYTAINRVRQLKFGRQLEAIAAPEMGVVFKVWLDGVARAVATDYPRRSGKSADEIPSSARARYSATFDSIEGYFLVSAAISGSEYGATIVPKNAKALAIPILDGLYPDGRPKRLGPNSWRSLGSFVYKSRKTGKSYIAYKSKTDGQLKILYVLVPKAVVKPMRRFRKMYDRKLPNLVGQFSFIMMQALSTVYNQQFIAALNSIDHKLKMGKVPSVIPDAGLHGERLVPKYK